ncbi:MAG: hypothetical protein QCI82_10355 [Candidatus Thermoplasmatota archaeon]|nr:hypothetical protein [Candidatus Thermoplasmatota archaeon]
MPVSHGKDVKNFDTVEVLLEGEKLSLYEVLDDSREVLYVGVGPLKLMLKEHLPDGVFPLREARYYRTFTDTDPDRLNERRRFLIDDYVDLRGKPPKYNL